MKNNTKLVLGAIAASIIISGGTVLATQAQTTDSNKMNGMRNRPENCQMHRNNENFGQMKEIMDNQDYDAWAEIMQKNPNSEELVTKENFEKMIQAHQLMSEGKREEAKSIMEELGIKGPRFSKGMRNGHGDKGQYMGQMKEIMDNHDYDAWAEIMQKNPNSEELVTKENFEKMIQAHKLMQSGNHDEAREIMQSIGMGRRK